LTRGLMYPYVTYSLYPGFCMAIIPQKANLVYTSYSVNGKIQSAVTYLLFVTF
jgi:hypothetical protein